MYRLYGQNKITGWEKINEKKKLEQILNTASKLTPNDYYAYIVIENNGNGDNVLIRESLYKEVEVVYEDIKPTIEVKTTTFQVGKEKEIKETIERE